MNISNRVVSYSFYRHPASDYESERCGEARGRFFVNYLPTIIRAHHSVFPDWEMRIHHDDTARQFDYFKTLERMHGKRLLRLVDMGTAHTLCGSMLWRLRPLFDPDVRYFVCRDVDSLSTPRERRAVERWVGSGKPVMSMQDSVSHRGTYIMGGMCGFDSQSQDAKRWSTWEKFEEAVRNLGIDMNQKGADQKVLGAMYAKRFVHLETPETLGGHDDPRDTCGGHARHIGGAFFSKPVRDWYDQNGYSLKGILEAERDCGWSDK